MKADISADSFRPARHFDAVVVGQGQVLVDSTLNEQEQIARRRHTVTTTDTVGTTGAPKDADGFAVSVAPGGRDLLLSPGRFYVDGILCENESDAFDAGVELDGSVTSTEPSPNGRALAVDQWLGIDDGTVTTQTRIVAIADGRELTLDPALPASAPPGAMVSVRRLNSLRSQPDRFGFDPFAAGVDQLADGAWRAELDVWHRLVTEVEDPSVRDTGLGDAAAAGRLRTVWQLRLTEAGAVGGGSCDSGVRPGRGMLIASTRPGPPVDEACVLPDEGGYRGLENQLYRIEVHSASSTTVELVWQRDNASTVSRVIEIGSTLLLEDMGRDEARGFAGAAWVEISDDHLELESLETDLLPVVSPDADHRTVELGGTPSRARLERGARARRWDGRIVIDLTSPSAGESMVLEHGLQVALMPGELRPGDYWLVPARTATFTAGTIEWPIDARGESMALEPFGTEHHSASLAVVDVSGGAFVTAGGGVRECRSLFPSLSDITAKDVSVDASVCDFGGASTVQDALEYLCERGGSGMCTATAVPEAGWERVFTTIPAGADADICFPRGTYPVTGTVTVAGKGRLVLHGVGLGSAIVSADSATALAFESCTSVKIERLSVVGLDSASTASKLAGVVNTRNCSEVVISDSRLRCTDHNGSSASSLRVTGGSLRVEDTLFEVGGRQSGVVATDTTDVVVVRCHFTTPQAPIAIGSLGVKDATRAEKQQVKRLFYSGLKKGAASGNRVGVTIGGETMSFLTTPEGKTAISAALGANFDTMREFQKSFDRVIRGVIAGTPVAAAQPLTDFFVNRVLNRRIAVMRQAIVVAGSRAGDIRIASNTIDAAVQGVHIGTSHEGQPRGGPADRVGSVRISDNAIRVFVPAEGARARHGIFVGAADLLRITGNDLSFATRAEGDWITSEGIRIYGFVGRLMVIRDNAIDSFPVGITLNMFMGKGNNQISLARMWAVEDNLIIGGSPEAKLTGPLGGHVVFRGNRPGPIDT